MRVVVFVGIFALSSTTLYLTNPNPYPEIPLGVTKCRTLPPNIRIGWFVKSFELKIINGPRLLFYCYVFQFFCCFDFSDYTSKILLE